MQYRQTGAAYIVSLARGEKIVASLQTLCETESITLASLSGIGAAEQLELAYYNVDQQQYSTKLLEGEHEITALLGNITTMKGKPYLHLHITVGDKDFTSYAGHLKEATVSGACEIIIHTLEGTVDRAKDETETGLNLLQL